MHDEFNDLLLALSDDDRARVAARLSRQDLVRGSMLHDLGDPIDYCYFPSGSAVASYRVVMAEGFAVETATIGREGVLGGVVSHGRIPAFARSSVLQDGTFLRIALSDLDQLKQSIPAVERLFDRYAECFMAQVLQSNACSAAHTIEQRVARWLIAATWRSGSKRLVITQEQLGELLGVGRTYASRVLQRFKDGGMIEIGRGRLTVVDEGAIREAACSCNAAIASHYATVLGGIYPE